MADQGRRKDREQIRHAGPASVTAWLGEFQVNERIAVLADDFTGRFDKLSDES
jgi:hypothetical protein